MKVNFRAELERLLNRESMENGSDTPGFLLADYLVHCLNAFDKAVRGRERFYGRPGASAPSREADKREE